MMCEVIPFTEVKLDWNDPSITSFLKTDMIVHADNYLSVTRKCMLNSGTSQ